MYQVGQTVALLPFDHFSVVRCLEIKMITIGLNHLEAFHYLFSHHRAFVHSFGVLLDPSFFCCWSLLWTWWLLDFSLFSIFMEKDRDYKKSIIRLDSPTEPTPVKQASLIELHRARATPGRGRTLAHSGSSRRSAIMACATICTRWAVWCTASMPTAT